MSFYIIIGNILKPLLNMESGDYSRKSHLLVSLMLRIKFSRPKRKMKERKKTKNNTLTNGHG